MLCSLWSTGLVELTLQVLERFVWLHSELFAWWKTMRSASELFVLLKLLLKLRLPLQSQWRALLKSLLRYLSMLSAPYLLR